MSLRVLHVVCGEGFAGVERYIASAAAGLDARGVAVVVVGGHETSMRSAFESTGVWWRPGASPVGALASAMRAEVDLVHAHMTEGEAVGVLVGLARRVPVISTRHFGAGRGSSAATQLLGRALERRLSAQIAISHFVAATAGSRCDVVHTGVPRVEHGSSVAQREPTVLLVQRLEPEKDGRTALRAWAASGLALDGWRMRIAGTGHEARLLVSLAAELGVSDSVDFLGHCDDVASEYARASILLAPTPLEGLGLSVVEAMAHGLPVVASDAGGHRETVGAVRDPALFTPGDVTDAAQRLRDLALDPVRREEYGARLQDRQRGEFSIDRQMSGLIRIYERVLG